jgi:DNA-nicking Smr family endonuclease
MSPRDGNRRRVLSYDERVLWSAVTQSIAPLRGKTSEPQEPEAEAPAPPARPQAAKTATPASAPPRIVAPPPPPLAPLDRRMKKRVAGGQLAIDGRFDLHGYTQAEAHVALSRFLHAAAARGARLVLVITGKSGVLKRQVPQWLALPEFRSLVVGFENAHITHGGEGALYVRVRRVRGA